MKWIYKKAVFALCIMALVFAASPSAVSAYAVTDYDAIDSQIRRDVEKNHIPGMAVIVVNSEEILFSGTYGNCESIDTPFIIGSMSKSFTALAVMQLVEQGKIALDAPIARYLDCSLYLKVPAQGEEITVKQLLNQTSGLDTYHRFGNAKITDSYGKYKYANVNYGLLGKIIEAVSGETYSDYVEQYIFTPLAMDKTSATLEESKADGLIVGYRNYFGIPVAGEADYPDENSWSQVSAGYISSSAEDMGKYLQMYLRKLSPAPPADVHGSAEIISESSIDTMFYDNVSQDESGQNFYGMGWGLSYGFLDEPVLNHSGLVENYTSNMFLLPESGIGVVVLVNMNDYLAGNNLLGNIIMPLLGGEKQDLPENSYVLFHALLDAVYLLILFLAAFPLITIKKWKGRSHGKKMLVWDMVRHAVFPVMLVCLPYLLGIPLWVVYYFVKDLFFVLVISAALLLGTGIYKIPFYIF